MPIRPDIQLEKCIDDALRKNDFKPLKTLLQIDICEDVKIKCSRQFLYKLDDLICRELNKKDIQTTSTILVSVGRCAKNIRILGQVGLLTMIKQGLVQKEIILSRGNSKDEAIINLIEDIFDLLMDIHGISDEGKRQVVESFIPQICALVTDSRVNICLQQETLKKMNAILDKMPQDARKILSNQEMLNLMSSMGERILDAGDYDLQVGIVEALCRMTTEKQRRELARQWFSMDFIANAFKGIKDSEFETDCRIFLNLVNGILGDKRRVFTFPCLSAFLDKYELQIPSDEKLEEFWIDFNLGSQTLSFYIAGDNDDHQWEAVTVPEEKIQMYSIEVRESKKLLTIILKNIVKISKREGKELLLYFDASLEITKVAQKIWGADKYREFARKQGISVAKTSVHVFFDSRGSQILVPESQFSAVEEKSNPQKELAKPPKYIKNSNQGDIKNSQLEITTPSKRKVSEASMIVPGSDRYTVRSPLLLIDTSTPRRRRRIKPPLQMMSLAEKDDLSKISENGVDNAELPKSRPSERINKSDNTEKHIKTAKKTEKDTEFPNQNSNELQDIVPDLQAVKKIDKPVLPGVLDNSCENKMHSKWACWTPVTTIKLYNDQGASTLSGDTFNQDIGINKKHTEPTSSSSISDDDSEETGKVKYKKAIVEHNKTDKAETCKRNNQQQNHPKYSEQKNIEGNKQSDWRIESETTFKSVLLNKTVEESMIYRKKYILSKDVKTSICDESPSPRKNVTNQRKSGKEVTSEFNSWDLRQKQKREKSKEKEFTSAAESLICQINKRYKSKDDIKCTRNLKESLIDSSFSNKSDLQFSKEKVQKQSHRKLKTTFVDVTSECPLNDVYNFNVNGADEPIIKLGIQEFQATTREACVDNSIKLVSLRNHDELESSLKVKDKEIMTNHKKKNPFSDDETEYRYDDSKTDISWLREPRSKPQLIDYSRNKNVKTRPSLDKGEPSSKMVPNKNVTKKVDMTVPCGRTRLPRRAAKAKKNYKDLSNSESESEQEFSHSLAEKLLVKEENIHSRTQTRKLPKKQQKVISAETQEELAEEWGNASLKDPIRDKSPDLSPLSGSPSSIEVMRCIEKKTEKDFTQDCDYVTESLSPYPKPSSPESLNSESEVGGPVNSSRNNRTNLPCARENCSPIPQPLFLESHSPSPLLTSSERGEKIWFDMPCDTTHISGLAQHLSCKRMYTNDNLSNSSEVEVEEEEDWRTHLLPKRWCRTEDVDHHLCTISESISPLSTNDISFPEEPWDSNASNVGMICDKINSEFKRKIHIRHKMMDYFTKQSWKMAEQHWKAVTQETREHRINKLNKFQFIIIEELENFEKDSQSLKDLEKEFADFWEKIFEKFRAYQRSEQQRLHLLKTSLDTNVFYNTDYEETIYTSEMCLMKENMRLLQDRLLQEMQEEELLDVRRGLMTLFMAHERNVNV